MHINSAQKMSSNQRRISIEFRDPATGPRSAVGNVSGNRCESDSSFRGHVSSIPARSHTFVEIDYEIISTVILLPSAESFRRWIFVSYKRKYVHEVLVNCLFKLAQEKKCG